MVLATKTLLRLLYLSFFTRKDLPSRRRTSVGFCLKFFALFSLFELFNAVCLLLDEVLFPAWRRARIEEPIFVIGNPRSGTTILHRVMAVDEQRFFCFRTWEIVFPSVLQKKVVSAIGRLDRLTGNRLRAFLLRAEAKRLEKFQHIHQTGLFLPEEDDKLSIHILASVDLGWCFPYGGFEKLARFDVAVDSWDQRRIMEFYERCLRRQAYFKRGQRTLLSKNPFFSGRVASLRTYFPDCRIIYLVRNPLDVVPSMISLARVLVRSGVGVEPETDLDEEVYEAARYYYAYPLEQLSTLPEDRFIVVNYDDLTRQPKQVIERIYKQFGFALTPEFEQRLDREVEKMQRHKSRHAYSRDQCSITSQRIVSDLKPVLDRFGFDAGDHGHGTVPASPSRPARAGVVTGHRPLASS